MTSRPYKPTGRSTARRSDGSLPTPGKSYDGSHPINWDKAEEILQLISKGDGLKRAGEKTSIDRRTIKDWAAHYPEFNTRLQLARRDGYEHWADEILEISDSVKGNESNAQVQAARLAVDSRKWLLSKLKPETYGDRVELTGKDGAALIPPSAESAIPRLMQVLAVLLPGAANSKLHELATNMAGKLTAPLEPVQIGDIEAKPVGKNGQH